MLPLNVTTMHSLPRLLLSYQACRLFSSSLPNRAQSFPLRPSPPPLPKAEQDVYEKLQRSSNGAFSAPIPSSVSSSLISPDQAQQASSEPASLNITDQLSQLNSVEAATPNSSLLPKDENSTSKSMNAKIEASGDGDELHPNVRRGAKPEFEGDRNPKTGEVGGPKNDPLRWGGDVDWSYNGRVTDF